MLSQKDIFILIEQDDLDEVHFELISEGKKLADALGEKACCMAMRGVDDNKAAELACYGVDKIYVLDDAHPLKYCAESAEIYVDRLSAFFNKKMPRKLLCSDSRIATDLASRLAARMKTGLVTGCVGLSLPWENKSAIFSKPVYAGNVIGNFLFPNPSFEIVTVKNGALEKKRLEAPKPPEIITIKNEPGHEDAKVKTLGIEKADPDQIGLDEADIIITGGRGMGSSDNFNLLNELANRLGAVVAGSLGAVDEGWIPRKKLIGQTGTTVAPKIYIACGVSGSIYHLMGMRESKAIIAINKDRYAPIFKCADFGIVGDAMEVIPLMLNHLQGSEN